MISAKRFSYNGNINLKAANSQINWSKSQIKEYKKCMDDIIYFAQTYFKIVHIDDGLITIVLTDYQKDILKLFCEERFVVLLQARQSFKSTTTTIFLLWFMLFNDYKTIALLANKAEAARELLSRIQLAYENLPTWLQQGVVEWNKGSFELENGSKILAASTSSSGIRGKSIAVLYIDEAAFIPNNIAEEFMRSVYPTISSGKKSKVFQSSTPNGLNLFYKLVEDAKAKRNKYKYYEVLWDRVPGRDQEWKEETIANTSIEAFSQEHDCLFLGSGGTLIKGSKLATLVFQNPLTDEDKYKQYYLPVPEDEYVVTVDVSQGLGQDYSVINVINITESPFQQVAVFRDNEVDPDFLPEVIMNIATEYNEAMVLVERNDIGCKVVDTLYHELEYEHTLLCTVKGQRGQQAGGGFGSATNTFLGVKMTKTVKAQGCSGLKNMIENDELIINDFTTIQELSSFVRVRTSYQADEGASDDIVMCLVSFGWLVKQQYFKDLTDIDFRGKMSNKYKHMIEDQMLPFGFLNNGLENDQEIMPGL